MSKTGSRFTRKIKMNFPTEMKDGKRRCGKCGEWNPLADYKTNKPGYHWKCSDCRKYTETYK